MPTSSQGRVPRAARRLEDACRGAYRLGADLGCPLDVPEEACRLLEQAREADLTQGRDMDALAAACLLAACRRLRVAHTEDEVAAFAKVPSSEIQASYKALVHGLHLAIPVLNCFDYISGITARLDVPPEVEERAWGILKPVCCTTFTAGKNPLGWAAAALVLAAREVGVRLSVNKVSKAAGVSPSTTQARIEELEARGPAPG